MMKKLFLTLTMLGLLIFFPDTSNALESGKIRINQIEVNDFLSGKQSNLHLITILDKPEYAFEYSETEHAFFLKARVGPYKATLRKAQKDIMDVLDVGRNQLCYLGIYATASRYIYSGDESYTKVPACEGPEHVDFNNDRIVNGIDLSEALDSADTKGPDMVADLNLNGYIDATDISSIIQYYGSTVSLEEAPVQQYSLGADE